MAFPSEPSTPQTREKAQSKVRHLTRGAVIAAAGLTALIGVVVAEEHPGSGSAPKGSGTSSPTTNGESSNTGGSGSGSTADTTTTTTSGSSAPTSTSSRPTVTSGGTSS
jgi:hypothetical protein